MSAPAVRAPSSGEGYPSILHPPAWLGIIGGGQLGRMFVHAAQRMGYRVVVLAPEPDAPAAQAADERIVGAYDSLEAVRKLSRLARGVTVEFENISAPALRWLEKRLPVRPGWRPIRVAQNRIAEKTFLTANRFPLAHWAEIRSLEELRRADATLGYPWVLKTAAAGYDGKGQVKITAPGEADDAWASLGRPSCVGESWVSFAAELSVIAIRSADGSTASYAVSENRHSRHILDTAVMPADVGPIVSRDARELAVRVASALGIVGVLTVEMFLSAGGGLLINELAPRPHNSGHSTIEACVTSQFEQQVRALAGLPLGSTDRYGPSAAMANLLGDLWARGEPDWAGALAADPGVKLHLYGKTAPAPGRKMGHLTVLDHDAESARARALAVRARLERDAGGKCWDR